MTRAHSPSPSDQGFTLIELLVALLLFSLVAIAAYRGLDSVLQTRAHLDQETRKWQSLARFFTRLDGETAQALRRQVRSSNGSEQAAWLGLPSAGSSLEDVQLAFTRAGGIDAEGLPLPPQRIGYRLRQHRLQRLHWDALDHAQNSKPTVDTLVEGVSQFDLRYLGPQQTWLTQWPPAGVPQLLPRAMEVKLVLDSGEQITRLLALQ